MVRMISAFIVVLLLCSFTVAASPCQKRRCPTQKSVQKSVQKPTQKSVQKSERRKVFRFIFRRHRR